LQFLYRQSIRRQLIAVTLALLLPMGLAIAWSANLTRTERRNEVRDQAASTAVMAAAQLEQYFDGLDAMAYATARHPIVMSFARERIDGFFTDLLRSQPLISNVVLASPEGRVLAAGSAWPKGLEQVPDTAVDGIVRVVQSKQPYVGDFVTSPITGRPTVLLGYPVTDDRQAVVGVLGFAIDLARLQSVFSDVPLPEGSVVTVVDRDNRVIARSRDADAYIGKPAGTSTPAPNAPAAASLRTDVDGVSRFSADVAVRASAWTLSVGIPRSIVYQRLRPLWFRNIVIVAAAFFTVMGLGLVIAWQTSLHLNRLRSAAERMAGGDLSPLNRVQTPNLEFRNLQDTFITMATNLRDARDALDRQMVQERRMNEELQLLQRQVVRQERLTAVGLLVSGVAHEVNNPLQAILGTAELLERHPSTPRDLLDEIAFLKTQAGRAREIIRNLSRFSSQQSGPPALVDLRDVIAEVVQLRRRDLEIAGIRFEVEASTSPMVYANFTELEQVILNFVINAQQSIEAARADGRIVIRLREVGRGVRLEVLDNGPGVAPTDEPKLFQPFFTTKPVGKGTGLGLSVSYGIIDSYGGAIGYTRNEWGGATFFFELPAADHEDDARNDRAALLLRSV
jgi:C4-dicarboxylate-specific signal transduction histidine kinase